jgi:3-oxoadipate enol-lactonase
MGGVVGMWLGSNAPERIDRLVLANTGAKIGTTETWDARIDTVRKRGMAAVAPAVLGRFFSPQLVEQPTPMVAQVRATLEATSAEGYAASCAAVRDADLRRSLAHIRAPVLVIVGSGDLSTPPGEGRFIADQIPGARFLELPATHLSNIQAAQAFTQALVQFLTGRA